MTFDGTQKLIGRGAQAEVFLYQGFAYKVYKSEYPTEWIEFEKQQQKEVNKAGICSVKYYDTDDSHIIKMDYVQGQMLETRINQIIEKNLKGKTLAEKLPTPEDLEEIVQAYKLFGRAFEFVHSANIQGLNIPHLKDTAALGMNKEDSEKILPVIERLSSGMKNVICHLDMHFLNIMLPMTNEPFSKTSYTIIDWMNARIAPAVFDYARTYVVLDEASKEALELFKQIILPDLFATGVTEADFNDAVQVCSIIREQEKKN